MAKQRKRLKEHHLRPKTDMPNYDKVLVIEKIKLWRTIFTYGCPTIWLLCFIILYILILYGPQDKIDNLIEIMRHIGLTRWLCGIIIVILIFIFSGRLLYSHKHSQQSDDFEV